MRAAIEFLRSIGIRCEQVEGATGFLPGVAIMEGGLLIDPHAHVSNVLHEGAHLAILPSGARAMASGDIGSACQAALNAVAHLHPDDPAYRAAIQTSDPEATAWAYAAGVALGIPMDQVIRDQDYEGTGDSQRLLLKMNRHSGIHGLQHGGFCAARPGPYAEMIGLPVFPKLARWLQV